jgi:hypothetical protein
MTNAIAGFTASLLLLLSTATAAQAADRLVLLASTIGPVDAGIVPLLIVEDFGRDKYGAALFFPNSREWVAQKRSR